MTGITIEHQQIRNWTESRGARPAISSGDNDVALPQIHFPEDQNAREVSWDEWLSWFERGQWAFIWQDTTPDRQISRFCKLVPRFQRLGKNVRTTG